MQQATILFVFKTSFCCSFYLSGLEAINLFPFFFYLPLLFCGSFMVDRQWPFKILEAMCDIRYLSYSSKMDLSLRWYHFLVIIHYNIMYGARVSIHNTGQRVCSTYACKRRVVWSTCISISRKDENILALLQK